MAVRSRPLWSAFVPAGTLKQVVYTVPADRTLVLRTTAFANDTVTNTQAVMWLRRGGVDYLYRPLISLGVNVSQQYSEWLSLGEGDAVLVSAAAAARVTTFGFGSLLDGDPS